MDIQSTANTVFDDFGHDDFGGHVCKDGRSRTWMLLLYLDDPIHQAVLDGRLSDLDWNFAGRLHDMDEGVKHHHHVVVLFKDARKAADVAADLGIDSRWLRPWDSKKKAFRYLCHRDNLKKFQYSPDGIYGTLSDQAISACLKGTDTGEAQSLLDIVQLLGSIDGYVTYSFFLSLVAEKGLFAVFRRLGVLGVRLLDEHNEIYRTARQAELFQSRCDRLSEQFSASLDASAKLPFDKRCEQLEIKGFPPAPFAVSED